MARGGDRSGNDRAFSSRHTGSTRGDAIVAFDAATRIRWILERNERAAIEIDARGTRAAFSTSARARVYDCITVVTFESTCHESSCLDG